MSRYRPTTRNSPPASRSEVQKKKHARLPYHDIGCLKLTEDALFGLCSRGRAVFCLMQCRKGWRLRASYKPGQTQTKPPNHVVQRGCDRNPVDWLQHHSTSFFVSWQIATAAARLWYQPSVHCMRLLWVTTWFGGLVFTSFHFILSLFTYRHRFSIICINSPPPRRLHSWQSSATATSATHSVLVDPLVDLLMLYIYSTSAM